MGMIIKNKLTNKVVSSFLYKGTTHTFQKEWDNNMSKSKKYKGMTIDDFEAFEDPALDSDNPNHADIGEYEIDLVKDATGKVTGYKKMGFKVKVLPVKINNINQIDITKTTFTKEEQGMITQAMLKFLKKQVL